MGRSARGRRAPVIEALHLGGLVGGDQADLVPKADLEMLRYGDCSLPRLDLTGARLSTVELAGVTADEADLRGTRLREVALDRIGLPVVRASRSEWRDVRVAGRLGSVEAYDAQWRAVHFTGCKLDFVNLRGAELTDVLFTDCVVDELDLLGAVATRVAFEGCRVRHVSVQDARLHDVDLRGAALEAVDGLTSLRGAIISPAQLTELAPLLAAQLGISVED